MTYDGKFPLDPKFLDHPDDCVSARHRTESIVLSAKASMLDKGLLEYDVTVLIWEHEYYGCKFPDGKFEYKISQRPHYTIQVISGDHTCEAIRRILLEQPDWMAQHIVNCVVIISKQNPQTEQYANIYGNLCNLIKNTAKAATITEVCMQLHDKYSAIESMSYTAAQKKRLKSDCTKAYVASTVFKSTTMGSASALASKTGKVWKLIVKIFTGDVHQPANSRTKFKIPASITNFIHTANIPDTRLEKWLQRIVDGEGSVKEFQSSCLSYKKQVRVHALILEFYNTLYSHQECKTMDALIKKFPPIGHRAWLATIVSWVGNAAKDRLTPEAKGSIKARLDECEKSEAARLQREVVITMYFLTT